MVGIAEAESGAEIELLDKLVLLLSGHQELDPDRKSVTQLERLVIEEAKRILGKERVWVACVPYANHNPYNYTQRFIGYWSTVHPDTDIFTMPIPTEKVATEQAIEIAKKKLDKADIVYLGGGDPRRLLDIITQYGLADILKQKRFFIGFSAGAYALLSTYYIPNDESIGQETRLYVGNGLGIVKGVTILVHGESMPYDNDYTALITEIIRTLTGTELPELVMLYHNTGDLVRINGVETHRFVGNPEPYARRIIVDGDRVVFGRVNAILP